MNVEYRMLKCLKDFTLVLSQMEDHRLKGGNPSWYGECRKLAFMAQLQQKKGIER